MRQSTKRFNAHMEHVPSDENDLAISFINNQDFGWKADVCKLQKHHAEYGSHCDALNLAQLEKDEKKNATTTASAHKNSTAANATVKPHKKVFGENSTEFNKALEKARSW